MAEFEQIKNIAFTKIIADFTLEEVRLARKKCISLMRDAQMNMGREPQQAKKYNTEYLFHKKRFEQCVQELKDRKLKKKMVDMSERSC